MAASEACPTEDSIQALLDYLVDPLLPAKSSPRDIPSESQQQLVAKQMHAAILLYNYYHRKKYPQLELLRFESFCKLAVALKPTLLSHMKLMQQSDDVELDNVEKQLSITEKAIMTACDISASLEASKTCIPNVEGWPLSKITVFLTDSKRENCHLIFNSITQGVWSAIEKDLDILKQRPEGKTEVKIEEQHTNKRRRVIRKITKEVTSIDEARIQQLAYLAVKEATGINSTDLIVLERHVVYSLDREKSAARFYIMQCTQSTNVDVIQVPMKDIMDSCLQGPFFEKTAGRWAVTPVVEYFRILPHSGILLDWFHRRGDAKVNANINTPEQMEQHWEIEIRGSQDRSPINSSTVKDRVRGMVNTPNTGLIKVEDKNGCSKIASPDSYNKPKNVKYDDPSRAPSHANDKKKDTVDTVHVEKQHKMTISSMEIDSDVSATGAQIKNENEAAKPVCGGENVSARNVPINSSYDQNGIGDHALFSSQSQLVHLNKVRDIVASTENILSDIIASNENILSETAVRALIRKRNKQSLLQRRAEEEIAWCDKKIQTIMTGGEGDLRLKIESIIEGCNDVCEKSVTGEKGYCPTEDQCSKTPSEELDCLCHKNVWSLPTYRVSVIDGGFLATVNVKRVDCEFSTDGELRAGPREAMDSAAAKMLSLLRTRATAAR